MKYLFLFSIFLFFSCLDSAQSGSIPDENMADGLDIQPEVYAGLENSNLIEERSLRIAHVSDVHHYAPSLYNRESPAFIQFSYNNEGRTVLYSTEMMAVLKEDLLSRGIGVLLISGDLSVLGSRETHKDMARILSGFESDGIEVYVTTGNHDISNPRAFRIVGAGTEDVESVEPEEFRNLYYSFGFEEAILSDSGSLSYLAPLDNDVYLLALDSSYYEMNYDWGYSVSGGFLRPSQYQFVRDAIGLAERDSKKIIVMSHHNFLEHYEIDFDLSNFMIDDDERMLNLLMDRNIKVGLSGHIHKSDIKEHIRGEKSFFGITTGSLQIYPHSYRLIGWDENELFLTTTELKDRMIRDGQRDILDYNRMIGMARSYTGQYERLVKTSSEEDARKMAEYFFLVNLYAQQGLEAYLPESVLQSGGLELIEKSESRMKAFARILPLDSYPDDRNVRISW